MSKVYVDGFVLHRYRPQSRVGLAVGQKTIQPSLKEHGNMAGTCSAQHGTALVSTATSPQNTLPPWRVVGNATLFWKLKTLAGRRVSWPRQGAGRLSFGCGSWMELEDPQAGVT